MVASAGEGVNQSRPYIGLLNDSTFLLKAMPDGDG